MTITNLFLVINIVLKGGFLMNKNKVILITGCSTGLGRGLCEKLSKNDYTVIASARNLDKLSNLPSSMKVKIDVTDKNSIKDAVNKIMDKYERIDVLINNAGFSVRGAIEELNINDIRKLFDVNVLGIINMIQEVVPYMRSNRYGKIINIGSISGKVSQGVNGCYCASKHAVEAISDALRLELHEFNIQSTVIEPGAMNTNFFDTLESTSNKLMKNTSSPYSNQYLKDLNYRKIQKRKNFSIAVNKIVSLIEKPKIKARYTTAVEPKLKLLMYMPDTIKEFLLLHH